MTTPSEADKVNIVLRAPRELEFSLDVKRERMRNRQYNVIGGVEEIVFEPDRNCRTELLPEQYQKVLGRKLYWRERLPVIARTIPEEDLIFVHTLPLKDGYVWLPEIYDPLHKVNPYNVGRSGQSRLKPGEKPRTPRLMRQPIERLASAIYRNFLVFQPVAQITTVMNLRGKLTYSNAGDHRMPLSSLAGRDGRKMALLLDPYNGEIFFTGGAYGFDEHFASDEQLHASSARVAAGARSSSQ